MDDSSRGNPDADGNGLPAAGQSDADTPANQTLTQQQEDELSTTFLSESVPPAATPIGVHGAQQEPASVVMSQRYTAAHPGDGADNALMPTMITRKTTWPVLDEYEADLIIRAREYADTIGASSISEGDAQMMEDITSRNLPIILRSYGL